MITRGGSLICCFFFSTLLSLVTGATKVTSFFVFKNGGLFGSAPNWLTEQPGGHGRYKLGRKLKYLAFSSVFCYHAATEPCSFQQVPPHTYSQTMLMKRSFLLGLAALLSLTLLNQCVSIPAIATTPVAPPSPHVVYQDVSLACAQFEQSMQMQGLSFTEARAVRNYCLELLRASRIRIVERGSASGIPAVQMIEESIADGRSIPLKQLPEDFRSYFQHSQVLAEGMADDYYQAFGMKRAEDMSPQDLAILNEIAQKNLAETAALNAAYPRAGRFFEGPFKVFNTQMGKVPNLASGGLANMNRIMCEYYAEQISAIDQVLAQP